MTAPTTEECLEWIKKYHIPRHVVRHSIAVKTIAHFLGKRIHDNGIPLKEEVVEASAWLHDIFKVKDFIDSQDGSLNDYPEEAWDTWRKMKKDHPEPHDEAVARLLDKEFPEVATCIRENAFTFPFNRKFSSWESKILYYADKRAMHDTIVSLVDRLDEGHSRYMARSDRGIAISESLKVLQPIEDELMAAAQCTPEEINNLNDQAIKEMNERGFMG